MTLGPVKSIIIGYLELQDDQIIIEGLGVVDEWKRIIGWGVDVTSMGIRTFICPHGVKLSHSIYNNPAVTYTYYDDRHGEEYNRLIWARYGLIHRPAMEWAIKIMGPIGNKNGWEIYENGIQWDMNTGQWTSGPRAIC